MGASIASSSSATDAAAQPGLVRDARNALTRDAAHDAHMHAILVRVQQQLSSSTLSDDCLLQHAVQAAMDATNGEGASFEFLEGAGLRCAAVAGSHLLDVGRWVPLADSPLWPTLSTGKSRRCNDAAGAGCPLATGAHAAPVGAALAVPLRRDDAVVGALKVWSSVAGAFA
ncbi:MAG: GAF domain-containing protein, partial [Giesbergeria sp.]